MIAYNNLPRENCIEIYFSDLIDDIEGVTIYVVLGHIVVVLRVLHKCDFVTHFFIKEEAHDISN
jgi:hypothetical protein